jgi:hypothetical protein
MKNIALGLESPQAGMHLILSLVLFAVKTLIKSIIKSVVLEF